jgi:hypothetical protein
MNDGQIYVTLLLEGIVLRLQADLRWLEACEQQWTNQKENYEP